MTQSDQQSNWNVPNALTTLRLVMVPFFGWALLHDGGHSITWRWVAFALFVIAMITDKVDGTTTLVDGGHLAVGDLVDAVVVASEGVDLVARVAGDRR